MPASVLPWREKVVAKKPTYNYVYNMDKLFILLKDGKVLKGIKDKSCSHISIPDSVTSIGRGAFYGCTSLQGIDIPDSVTEIGERAFEDCTSLQSIDIPGSVTDIGWDAFEGCTSLQYIDIPNSLTKIGRGVFKDCTSLRSIDIPDSVTEIGWYAFEGCTSLQSIDIPDSVTSIESSALDGTKWYANQPNGMIYINKVLYKLKGETGSKAIAIREGTITISSYSFEGCSSLRSIDIPDSVTEIGWYAFKGCSSLKKIHIHRKNPCDINVDASAFEELYGDCVLLITPGTRWAYRHHPVFGKFKNIET